MRLQNLKSMSDEKSRSSTVHLMFNVVPSYCINFFNVIIRCNLIEYSIIFKLYFKKLLYKPVLLMFYNI